MALNIQTFRTRALTAVVFVIVMMAGLLLNRWSFFILFSIIQFEAWIEYQKLVSLFNPDYGTISRPHRYGIILAGWCILMFFTNDALSIGELSLTTIGFWGGAALVLLLPIFMLLDRKRFFIKNIVYSLFGLLYISLPLAFMVDFRTQYIEEAESLALTIPLLIIFSIWINDTMAYMVGSFIGKTPLSSISPKKTWEGTIGGIILTIIIIGLLAYFTKRIQPVPAAILAALASITGTIGDLFESKLKRMAGVKDSGSFMPGHGGFLDRFDSLLFAATACWVYIAVFV